MRQEQIDAIGGDVFALLISLLRPVARSLGADGANGEASPVHPPAQRLEMRVVEAGGVLTADVQIWLHCPAAEPVVLAWVLPLPAGAVMESLELHAANGSGERAGLCERREARTWFDLARRSSLPGALLAEDAPGVFSLELASPGAGAMRLALRYRHARASSEGDGEVAVTCEAAPGMEPWTPGGRVLRLGSGRNLESIVGIRPAATCERPADEAGTEALAFKGWVERGVARPTMARSAARPAIFAGCDRADGGSAIFRGHLAGRAVRLWADMRAAGRLDQTPAARLPAVADIDALMAQYRCTERSEAERRELAGHVARLGLEAGLATLWTSFVAVVGGEGPGGEMVFAAA